jgi:glycosyltransferase involved in cell wall biosynthesis
MPNPSITIALPARKSVATIASTLSSIQRQTFEDFELIVADDGSSDDTVEIARQFDDPRFRIISDGKSLGLPRRLNQLASLARGEFFARMDADDVMHPRRLELQHAALVSDPALDVVGTDAYAIDNDDHVVGVFKSASPSSNPWTVANEGAFIHPTVMGRTAWFQRNPYAEWAHRAEDLELWTRTCATSKFAVIHRPLLFYRLRDARDFQPAFASARMAGRIILTEGARIGAPWRARRSVAGRHARLLAYALYCCTGARSFAWKFRRLRSRLSAGGSSELMMAQHALDELLGPGEIRRTCR